jgi:hypothetical protein
MTLPPSHTPRSARDALANSLRTELLGPFEREELLTESPITRYVTGMLAPFGTEVPTEENESSTGEHGAEEEGSDDDTGSPMSQALTPSSIGISFLISEQVTELEAVVEWGDYVREEVEPTSDSSEHARFDDDRTSVSTGDAASSGEVGADEVQDKPQRPRFQWRRRPHAAERKTINLKPQEGLTTDPSLRIDNITIEHITRRIGNCFAVSVFLVNRRKRSRETRPPVEEWIFQPTLSLRSADHSAVFLPRELEPTLTKSEPDRDSNRLLFRKRREFAIGHGCAADWVTRDDHETAFEVKTDFIPTYEVPRVEAPSLPHRILDMTELAAMNSGTEVRARLIPLAESYEAWIKTSERETSALAPDLHTVARKHLEDCHKALKRIRAGLDLLANDLEVFRAFQFANRAMLLQRSHTKWSKQRKDLGQMAPNDPAIQGEWRPFQIAFILLNIPGIAQPTNADRALADLLWFPTGGGKTEAYLGLAAFTMALRRRRPIPGLRTDAGVSVLMRYTLRLLTIQQFQRAATLLCACEIIRQGSPRIWGDVRFSIGLWVGMKATPNDHAESRKSLARIQQEPQESGANPCQLESCPWCGETIQPAHYWTDGEAVRTRVACPRSQCEFSKAQNPTGIPALVVDEEIYLECPTMLIATVDKFAQMPWNGNIQSLFGFVNRECDRCGFLSDASDHTQGHRQPRAKKVSFNVRATQHLAPPDLIIQDELHLISGPLGTLVGLYESAVDFLSSRLDEKRVLLPKVIASTATVRRAFDQVQSVFHRHVRVFPPPALDPGNSFFAEEQKICDATPGRLYVGVCASGKSMKTAYVRTAAKLLSAGAGLRDNPGIAEPYQTLVSYFNSLRELGGAIRLLDDDIPGRLDQLVAAKMPRRGRPVYVELTSRIKQEQIPELLARLSQRHDALRKEDDPLPLDAVLASNMISVGVDVDRLGLMTVTGQPKTTSEYIQATSRVGRQVWGPGLVVTIYNWSRPRDLSHYERFRHYHATLYRNVEAVSATPFSSRALDRGLRGAFVAMVRLGSARLSPETSASLFDPQEGRIQVIKRALEERADNIGDQLAKATTQRMTQSLVDEWWGFAHRPLRYGWRAPDLSMRPREDVLLKPSEGGVVGHWATPQSLREVEDSSVIRVLGLDPNVD